MCMSAPKAPPPPAPPAPLAPPAPVRIATQDSRADGSALKNNRGRSSLRIDRTSQGTGTSGSGLNIPT